MGGSKLTVGVIIQARMGSTRLPGKVLRSIGQFTLLEQVLMRLSRLQHEVETVVATSQLAQNDPIAELCTRNRVACFRGSEYDVLDRYFQCAKHFVFSSVVRLTADNPFTDIVELDRLIELHLLDSNAFTHSFDQMPLGVGAEIFTIEALADSHRCGRAPHHREHVDEYMLENPELFKTAILKIPKAKRKPELRLTIDTEDDWRLANWLLRQAKDKWITTEQAIDLVSKIDYRDH